MSESAEAASIVLVKKRARRESKRRGRFSRSTRANYRLLGLKAGASRKAIERAYKLQARKNHPDCGGSEATMRSITAAYQAICAALPKRGRPPKHSQDHDAYAIVDEFNNNEPVLDGFESRQAAEQALSDLRERLRTHPENQSKGEYAEDLTISLDLNGRRACFVVVGPPGTGRVKAHRERAKQEAAEEARLCEKQKTPEYWNRLLAQSGLSVNRGLYLTDAPAGMGRLITGGWTATKLETVTAAHEASLGGPDAQTRRSRGGGFRCFGMIGNGPDPFEGQDPTADSADAYFEIRLSAPDGDVEREYWENNGAGKPCITASGVDALLGPSIEDDRLPEVHGSTLAPTIDNSEGMAELGIEDLSPLAGTDEFPEFPDFGEDEYNEVLDVFEDPNYRPPRPVFPDTPAPTIVPKSVPACNEIPRQFDIAPDSKLLKGNDLAAL